MKYLSNSLEETQKIAREFVNSLKANENGAVVVGLYGNLGSGKTSFTQGVAKAFGVEDTVVSPTFVIEKIYELTSQNFSHLIHIDAYRIEKSEELLHLGFREIIKDKGNVIFIEWPERVMDIIPDHIKINLKSLNDQNAREIEINDKN
jgi:tRNA threonylcarbamoyladenosine biosynthesis protein TsaE